MANQTRQLARLLQGGHVAVSWCRPTLRIVLRGSATARNTGRRSGWCHTGCGSSRAAGRADVVHVMANSGWAWHLFAAPAIWLSRLARRPVVVNYRGGLASEFLAERRARSVRGRAPRRAALVVPSRFLQEVFARHGMPATDRSERGRPEVFSPGRAAPLDGHARRISS